MFKQMRRADRALEADQATAVLAKGGYGILSTTGEDGYAYGVPLSYVYIQDAIYFHCAPEGLKLDNIRHNNRVSFCVVGDTLPLAEKFSMRYESVIVAGRASEVEGAEKDRALQALIEKYSGAYMEKGHKYIESDSHKTKVIRISIENITGKARR